MYPEDGTYSDVICKETINKILTEGRKDKNPRPKYSDGTPAHTYSINHLLTSWEAGSPYQCPLITLRPIAYKSAIKELFWIYQDQSNDLDVLRDKYGITWWNEWEIPNTRNIGVCYGETVRRHHLMDDFLDGLEKDPDGRRHIINMWQVDDFHEPHGLKPCCYQTGWNVVHRDDGDYLDMILYQRSSDYMTAGCINAFQYYVFLHIIAHCFKYKPGKFSWFLQNVQIYDRHIDQAKEMLERQPIPYLGVVRIDADTRDFYSIKPENVVVTGYPIGIIKEKNPQLHFDIGI